MSESEKEEGPIYIARGTHTWSQGTTPREPLIECLKHGADSDDCFKIIKLPDGAVNVRINKVGTVQWDGSTLKAQDVPLDMALIGDLEFELYDRLYLAVKIVELVERLQGSSSKYSKDLRAFVETMEENL